MSILMHAAPEPALLGGLAIKCSLVFGLAWFVQRALAKSSADVRHGLWRVTLPAVLAIPILSAILPGWRVPLPDVAVVGTETFSPDYSSELIAIAGQPGGAPADPVSRVPWGAVLTVIWISGTAVMLGRMLRNGWMLDRMVRHSPPLAGASAGLMEAACREAGVRQSVRLVMSSDAASPMTAGLFRPVVAVPPDFAYWAPREQYITLLHEAVHIRRRDWLFYWLGLLVRAVHWFNPLAWWAFWAARAACEEACDAAVLARGVRPSAYAGHLLTLAESLSERGRPVPSHALAMHGGSRLEERIMSILGPTKKYRRTTALAAAVAMAVCTALAAGLHFGAAEAASQEDPAQPAPQAQPGAPPIPPQGPAFGPPPHPGPRHFQQPGGPQQFHQPGPPPQPFGQPGGPQHFQQPGGPRQFHQPGPPPQPFGQPGGPQQFRQPGGPQQFHQPGPPPQPFGQPGGPQHFQQPGGPQQFHQPGPPPQPFGQPGGPQQFRQPGLPPQPRPEDIAAMFDRMDADKNGTVSKEEFVGFHMRMRPDGPMPAPAPQPEWPQPDSRPTQP